MGVNRAARFPGEHGANHVANRDHFRALLPSFALGSQRISCFARLADGDDQAAPADNGVAIAELTAVVHLNRNTGKVFDHEFPGQPRMPACAASNDLYIIKGAKFILGNVHLVEEDFSCLLRDPAEKRVPNGARLFENFLLHEMLEPTLFRHDRVPRNLRRRTVDRLTFEVAETNALWGQNSHLAITEKEDAARMLQNGRNIARHEEFTIAQTHHDWGPQPSGHDLVRIFCGNRHQSVGTCHRLDGLPNRFLEWRVLREFFDNVGDDFGVRLGDKFVAISEKLLFQLDVIFDDTVVHHNDLAGAVPVRMRVFLGGTAVRGPSRVADSIDALNGSGSDRFFKIAEFAWCTPNLEFSVVAYNGDASGIISAVFEALQPIQDQRNDTFGANVADNSAHSGLTSGATRDRYQPLNPNYASTKNRLTTVRVRCACWKPP